MSFQLKSGFFTSVLNSTNTPADMPWMTGVCLRLISLKHTQKKVCMYLFRYAAYKDILQMLETQYFLFLPHPNQNSLDFPCFELTVKMTSFCKKLKVNSGKTSTVFTFIPKPITKSLRELPFAWLLRCYGTGSLL